MLPLAVDLDGTLIRCDLFSRAMARFVRARPWNALVLLAWLTRGRAHAKAKLAALYPVNAAALPYNAPFLAWLRAQKAAGRTMVLATAFDRAGAEAVASHVGIFDQVLASNGLTNLKSRAKARALAAAFPAGFAYAGNESADIAVWRAAQAAVIVNATDALVRRAQAAFNVERVFPRGGEQT
jgi:phosphoserine phosphatase